MGTDDLEKDAGVPVADDSAGVSEDVVQAPDSADAAVSLPDAPKEGLTLHFRGSLSQTDFNILRVAVTALSTEKGFGDKVKIDLSADRKSVVVSGLDLMELCQIGDDIHRLADPDVKARIQTIVDSAISRLIDCVASESGLVDRIGDEEGQGLNQSQEDALTRLLRELLVNV